MVYIYIPYTIYHIIPYLFLWSSQLVIAHRVTEPSQASRGAAQRHGGPVGRQGTERRGEQRRAVALGEVLAKDLTFGAGDVQKWWFNDDV